MKILRLIVSVAFLSIASLQAQKVDSASKGVSNKPENGSTANFQSAVGNAAMAKDDYTSAITAFKAELAAVPIGSTQTAGAPLQDTWNLGQAYYKSTPPDYVNCTFYATRAAQFAPAPFKPQIQQLATYCYVKYHGGADGYEVVVASAKANLFPPADFTVAPAPEAASLPSPSIQTSVGTPPASGPTMEQTIAFINEAYTKQGDVSYRDGQRENTVANQAIALTAPCQLTFTRSHTYPQYVPPDAPGYTGQTGHFMETDDQSELLRLDRADPRTMNIDDGGKHNPTLYSPTVQQPSTQAEREREQNPIYPKPHLGYFFVKDDADRVAKAYIHAMVLCHKPEVHSIF